MHDINLGVMAKAKELIIDQPIIYPQVAPRVSRGAGVREAVPLVDAGDQAVVAL